MRRASTPALVNRLPFDNAATPSAFRFGEYPFGSPSRRTLQLQLRALSFDEPTTNGEAEYGLEKIEVFQVKTTRSGRPLATLSWMAE